MVDTDAMRGVGWVMALGVAASACDFGSLASLSEEQADPAPNELTYQARAIWDVYDVTKATDADVKNAISNILEEVKMANPPLTDKMGPLLTSDLALIGFGSRNPSTAQGMLLIDSISCSLDQIRQLVVAKNQTVLYPNLYDAYDREYTSSVQDFLSGASPTVTWQTTYTGDALGYVYNATLTGGARNVQGAMPDGSPVLLARTYLDMPADFTQGGGDGSFQQDYQIELYYATSPSSVIHFYGLWRDFQVNNLTSAADLYINLILGELEDFDTRSGLVCKNMSPQPAFQ